MRGFVIHVGRIWGCSGSSLQIWHAWFWRLVSLEVL